MTPKTKRITSGILMAIPTLTLIAGGIMKLIGAEPDTVVQFLTNMGFGNYLPLLGISELLIAALLIYPKTNRIGLVLALCYFSGALSLELAGRQVPASAGFLAFLWIALFLRTDMLSISPKYDNVG